jgi:hypothetical protein
LLNLIASEQQGIDVGFWYMSDARYSNALVKRFQEGLPVRVLMDDRADDSKPKVQPILDQLKAAGIPMRRKSGGGILHWKMMLFDGQNVVQFSKANYDPYSFVASQPGVSWNDEAIYFSDDAALVNTFRTKFDDAWTSTSAYANYANITGPLVRRYPVFPQVSWMNFPPTQDFYNRFVSRVGRETQRLDVVIFRINDRRYGDALINAANRGVPVRLIHDPQQYRSNIARMYIWHSYNIDRLYMAGVAGKDVQIKSRVHQGLLHEMAVVLYGLGEAIFGSSNFTTPSSNRQAEHNVFYSPSVNKPWFYQWFVDQFDRKWNNAAGFQPFQPLPPDSPIPSVPANGAAGVSSSVTLKWDGREFAHKYDIYFGPSSSPPLLARDVVVGSPVTGKIETFTVQNLAPGATYYWRIVGKTMANRTKSGPTWSFTTAGASGGGSSTPFGGTPTALPGTIQVENFDNGGSGIAYADTTAGNAGGVYRSSNVDIGPASDTGGGYYVGWTRTGEWLNYTVNVAQTGSYTLETRIAGVGTGARFHVEVDGVDVTGSMSVPNTGGWQTWQTINKSGISLTAGTRVVRLVFDQGTSQNSGVGNYNYLRFTTGSGSGGSGSTGPAPFSGTPVPVPGTLQAENFDTGGSGVAYVDTTAGNTGGAYRSTDVDLGPTTDVGGGYYVGWTRAGEWLKYSVDVTQSGTYTLDVRIASRGTGASFHVEVDGSNVTGPMIVPDTGGWQAWQTITKTGISLTAGTRVVRVVFDKRAVENQGVGNYNYLRFR